MATGFVSPSLTTDSWNFLDTSGGDNKDKNPNYLAVITCTGLNIQITANLPQDFSIDIGAQYEEAVAQMVASNQIVSELATGARMAGVQLVTQALTAQVWQGSTEISFSLPLSFQVSTDEYEDVLKPLSDLYRLSLPDEVTEGGFLKAPGPSLSVELLKKSTGAFTSGLMNTAVGSDVSKAVSAAKDKVSSTLDGVVSLFSSGSKTASAPGASKVTSPQSEGQKGSLASAITNNISLTLGQYMHFDSVVITNVGQTHHVQPLENGTMSRVDVTVNFKTFFVPTQKDIKTIFLALSAKSPNAGSDNPRNRH